MLIFCWGLSGGHIIQESTLKLLMLSLRETPVMTAEEQAEMQLPLPHSPGEVPADPSDFWGEALARQRRGNIRRRPEVLGRAAPDSGLVEQSLRPLSSRTTPV